MFGKCSRQAGELAEESVSLKIAHTAADGKNYAPKYYKSGSDYFYWIPRVFHGCAEQATIIDKVCGYAFNCRSIKIKKLIIVNMDAVLCLKPFLNNRF